MRKNISNILSIIMACAVSLTLVFYGCGVGSQKTQSNGSSSTVSGVATSDSPVAGTITLKDSSVPSQILTTTTTNGAYSFNTTGLKAPYVLMSEATGTSGSAKMYSIAAGNGRTNISPVSDIAFTASTSGYDAMSLYEGWDHNGGSDMTSVTNFQYFIYKLRDVLAPLFSLYQVSDPVSDDEGEVGDGGYYWLTAMFKDVSFTMQNGNLVVTNRSTGGVIYQAPLNNITSGTLNTANLPGTTTTPPSTCTSFTYSSWSACDSTGTQTRTVTASSPAGCTGGTPVLSQACTYVPPACTYTYSPWST